MSWQVSLSGIIAADFPAAVDALPLPSQGAGGSAGIEADFAVAKQTLKALAALVKRPYISASASGHTPQQGQGVEYLDGAQVSVSGSDQRP